jgi:hypothetical protein
MCCAAGGETRRAAFINPLPSGGSPVSALACRAKHRQTLFTFVAGFEDGGMSFVLMLIGIGATALGAILIGFGIPINEFSLGNTLILAGTFTSVSGLVIFAISRAVAQLSRIAELLRNQPVQTSAAPSHAADHHFDAAAPRAQAPRAPAPRSRAEPPARSAESRIPGDFEIPPEPERSPPPLSARPPAPAAEPNESLRAPGRAAPDMSGAAAGWRPPRPAVDPRARKPEPPRRPTGSENPPGNGWEDRASAAPAVPSPAAVPSASPDAAHNEPVTVLKSGVVDGMAYTLYTDGSIEAELAQGVVRFGSIEELRNHLEKSA